MSKSTDSQSDSRHGDSRLREFLRRAGPILVEERGWNERSQLKIKSLAEDLKLPDHLYDIGVERLQKGDLGFDVQFTVYEQAFINYLHKQFTPGSGRTVLTARHEANAIRIARREYKIRQVRARHLVRHVAEQLGMSRVSKLDAVEYVAAIIDEQIGNGTVVPESVRGRIRQSSKNWGVGSKQVEILISNRIEANRQISIPKSSWKIRVMAVVISLLIMLVIIWAAQKFIRGTMDPGETNVETGNTDSVRQPIFSPAPRWWSSETAERFRNFTADSRAARFPHELLKSDNDDDRLIGYQAIVSLTGDNRSDFCKQCAELFARFYADESVRVCRQMSQLIAEQGMLPTGALPSNTRMFARVWRAADLLTACADLPIVEAKTSLLDDIAFQLASVSIRLPDFPERSGRSLVAKQWQYLSSQSYSQPDKAARLIDQLGDLTRQEFTELNPAEYSTAVRLLTIRPGVWTSMRRTLERIIETASEDQLRELYLIKNACSIPEFQSWIGTRLANRLGIKTDRLTSGRIDEAIEQNLNLTTNRAGGLRPRWKRLNENKDIQTILHGTVPVNPSTIGQAVHYATIALLITQAEKSGDQRIIAKADELLNESPRNLAVRTIQLSSDLPVYRRIQRRALPSDIRTREETLRKLSDPDANSDQANATAFKQLAKAAPRLRDLPYDQSLLLARYMLEASETSELVAIEKYCSQMRHWPNLSLALADQLMHTNGSIDQALTCSSVLLGFQPRMAEGEWRTALRQLILDRVALGLRHTAEVQGDDDRYQWNELRNLLMDHYRLRCAAVGIPGATISAARTPAELAQLLVRSMDKTPNGTFSRQIEANVYLAENEMQLFALHGKILTAQFQRADPEPDESNDAADIGTTILNNEKELLRVLLGVDQ